MHCSWNLLAKCFLTVRTLCGAVYRVQTWCVLNSANKSLAFGLVILYIYFSFLIHFAHLEKKFCANKKKVSNLEENLQKCSMEYYMNHKNVNQRTLLGEHDMYVMNSLVMNIVPTGTSNLFPTRTSSKKVRVYLQIVETRVLFI